MSRSHIVCWTMKDQDYWEVFDNRADAKECYDIVVEDSYVAALTAVVESSDYETHPVFADAEHLGYAKLQPAKDVIFGGGLMESVDLLNNLTIRKRR